MAKRIEKKAEEVAEEIIVGNIFECISEAEKIIIITNIILLVS